MAAGQEDLIDFNIIESHKENIQSLPSGRSAKVLAALYSPPLTSQASPQSDAHATQRAAFEEELAEIEESDDPLDVYNRYIKWTLATYPSAQSTPSSQLLPLLERATKAFVADTHYKNDVRYIKIWLQYISLFSDAPREAFIFMARNGVGQEMALFYEEYAAWLEAQGRWSQAEEVFRLGMDKDARPVERLTRKFGEFQQRKAAVPPEVSERPDSPALPVVRQVLGQRVDPFAAATGAVQQDKNDTKAKKKSAKMAIFADEAPQQESVLGSQDGPGWSDIGSLQSRKKENTKEATSWAGQTLKVGKTNAGVEKMAVFRSSEKVPDKCHEAQFATNPKTGRRERVAVNLNAVYPRTTGEYCFEEIMARRRGWLNKDWAVEVNKALSPTPKSSRKKGGFEIFHDDATSADTASPAVDRENSAPLSAEMLPPHRTLSLNDENSENLVPSMVQEKPTDVIRRMRREERANRTRKIKMTEVRHEKKETQTVQLNLASPTGPKLKRKKTAEATMTINTKEAMDEIYGIFSQPAAVAEIDEEEEEDSDDDYTSGAESTMTGKMSASASEYGDETRREIFLAHSAVASQAEEGAEPEDEEDEDADDDDDKTDASAWSDYTKSKAAAQDNLLSNGSQLADLRTHQDDEEALEKIDRDHDNLVTPLGDDEESEPSTRYIPLPPEDYEPNNATYRDRAIMQNNRLPFMTPIAEQTESSIGTARTDKSKDYFNAKTPSRQTHANIAAIIEDDDEPFSSPFQEQVLEAAKDKRNLLAGKVANREVRKVDETRPLGPIIQDLRINPVDPTVRDIILSQMRPGLSSYRGFFDRRNEQYGRVNDIRRYAKALGKKTQTSNDKTASTLSLPPTLAFEGSQQTYSIKRELGAGAFAPVYLVERHSDEDVDGRDELEAMKMETNPPNAWEFHILSLAHSRLCNSRAEKSLIRVHEMHLFSDASFLIEEYADTGTLLDLVNLARGIDGCNGGAGAGLEESLAMFYTIELIRTVEALHDRDLIHGDLKCDNILLRLPDGAQDDVAWSHAYEPDGSTGWADHGVTLIDFGRTIDMADFRPDVAFVADWPTSEADCVEMRELRPWTHQVDYHGLAGSAHTLLFGKYMSVVPDPRAVDHDGDACGRDDGHDGDPVGVGDEGDAVRGREHQSIGAKKSWKIREALKRYWHTDIWGDFFALCLNSGQARYLSPHQTISGAVGNHETAKGNGKEARGQGRMVPTLALRRIRIRMEECLAGMGEGQLRSRIRRVEEGTLAVRRVKGRV